MDIIKEVVDKPTLYEQLAEEAAELTQAALKCSRILRGQNPTPVSSSEAYAKIIEEFSDVVQCARILGLKPNEDQIKYKNDRWVSRLLEKLPGGSILENKLERG